MNTDNKVKNIHYYIIIVTLVLVIFFLIRQLLQYPFFNHIKEAIINIFFPFLISFIIVYIFHPVLYWFEKRFSIKTWVSILVLITINGVLLIFLIEVVFPLLSQQIVNLMVELPKYVDQTELILNDLKSKYEILNNMQVNNALITLTDEFTEKIGGALVDFTISIVILSFKSIWVLMMIPLLVFIMMKDYSLIYDKVSKFLISHRKSEWIGLLRNIDKKLGAYIRGQLIIMSYMFIGTFIPLFILGMPNAFIFSLIIAITNIIPYLGPYLGGVPLCIYAYFQSSNLLIASLIIILVMQQFDGNLGQPLVYGSQLKIHPLKIIAVMLIGSAFAGVIGLLLSVPIFIILSEIFSFFKPRLKSKFLQKNSL